MKKLLKYILTVLVYAVSILILKIQCKIIDDSAKSKCVILCVCMCVHVGTRDIKCDKKHRPFLCSSQKFIIHLTNNTLYVVFGGLSKSSISTQSWTELLFVCEVNILITAERAYIKIYVFAIGNIRDHN